VVEVADGVKQVIDAMQGRMPAGTQVHFTYDKSADVKKSLANVEATLLEGGADGADRVPVSGQLAQHGDYRPHPAGGADGHPVCPAGAGLHPEPDDADGLSLSIGLLIDDAIVVRENIVRHRQLGKSHVQAALDGTNEIGLAVLATTLTVVAVFLPVGFMSGIIGKFFHQFGLTVTVAVLISMLVSFTLDPMLSSIWPDPHQHGDRHRGPLGRMLDWFEARWTGWPTLCARHPLVAGASQDGTVAGCPAIAGQFHAGAAYWR
jgi:HAE1 family hydrophobic/amphiphilic exporter-1